MLPSFELSPLYCVASLSSSGRFTLGVGVAILVVLHTRMVRSMFAFLGLPACLQIWPLPGGEVSSGGLGFGSTFAAFALFNLGYW